MPKQINTLLDETVVSQLDLYAIRESELFNKKVTTSDVVRQAIDRFLDQTQSFNRFYTVKSEIYDPSKLDDIKIYLGDKKLQSKLQLMETLVIADAHDKVTKIECAMLINVPELNPFKKYPPFLFSMIMTFDKLHKFYLSYKRQMELVTANNLIQCGNLAGFGELYNKNEITMTQQNCKRIFCDDVYESVEFSNLKLRGIDYKNIIQHPMGERTWMFRFNANAINKGDCNE